MDPVEKEIAPGAQLSTSTKVAEAQRNDPANSSAQLTEQTDPYQNEYNSPPVSMEAVSLVSSKNRGQLRAASIGVNPRGLRGAPPGFGAGLRNPPKPILTRSPPKQPFMKLPLEQIREPLPAVPMCPIDSLLDSCHLKPTPESGSTLGHPAKSLAMVTPANSETSLSQHSKSNGDSSQGNFAHNPEPFDTNPYAHRADEIGPSHHIPGVGHLGELLAPPDWKEGDEPIDPRAARKLFDTAREEAKRALDISINEARHRGGEEQEKRTQERDQQWATCNKLDQVLLKERTNVYEQYQKRKQVLAISTITVPLQPLQPLTETSYAMSPKVNFEYSPILHAQSSKSSSTNSTRSQFGDRSFPTASPGFLSPSVLDPNLMPPTLESGYKMYQAKQAQIQRASEENERFLASYINRYGPHLSDQQLSAGVLPPLGDQRPKPFYGSQRGYGSVRSDGQSTSLVPRPPQYVSPTNTRFNSANNSFGSLPPSSPSMGPPMPTLPQWTHSDFSLPRVKDMSKAYASSLAKSNMELEAGYENKKELQFSIHVADINNEESSGSKKRMQKTKSEKPKPWYYQQMQDANLPISAITAEALQAGLDYDVNAGPREKPNKAENLSPAKRRRNRPFIDPSIGIPISAEAGKLLISKGARDATKGPFLMPPGNSGPIATTMARVPAAPNGLSASYTPGPAQQSNYLFSRPSQTNLTPDPELSSDHPDDPNDADFGRRTTRHRSNTPRKPAAPRSVARAGNKRKSGGATAASKRSRLSREGSNYDENQANNRSNAFAILETDSSY